MRAFTGKDYDDDVPSNVAVVVSRMVARVLVQPEQLHGVNSAQEQFGPFMGSLSFNPASTEGGPWLTATDKMMLGHRASSGVSVRLASERFA